MLMDVSLLKQELKTYEENKAELVKNNNGKYVLIKGKEIVKIFSTDEEAVTFGIKKFGNVPFLVKKIQEVEQTQYYTSSLIKLDD